MTLRPPNALHARVTCTDLANIDCCAQLPPTRWTPAHSLCACLYVSRTTAIGSHEAASTHRQASATLMNSCHDLQIRLLEVCLIR